jgi:secreted PhoX family phosphatase
MKKCTLSLLFTLVFCAALSAQFTFDPNVPANYDATTVVLPASPLKYQVIFVGQLDTVQTTPTYGNPAGAHPAKQWHDFIGVTADPTKPNEFWVSVNHEMQQRNDFIGDGGGMTAFKVRRDANTDTLVVIEQSLNDGRKGKFFNVDFVNTVGETGMNCAGIVGPDGRIWTAEEWQVSSNSAAGSFLRDTTDFIIDAPEFPAFDGKTIKKYQNLNWMVEIDPKQAKAIRKQYNWGRLFYEGGAISSDNRTVYMGEDATPGLFTKFVADVPGDFTKGKFYVYAHTKNPKWVELDNTDLNVMLNPRPAAIAAGATVFNRLEWVAINEQTGNVYIAETGRDDIGKVSGWRNAITSGASPAEHHVARAATKGLTPVSDDYTDIYGRVLCYNPSTEIVGVLLEGGPDFSTTDVPAASYPEKHLASPDGLNMLYSGGKAFLIISEDLNGRTYGRMPDSKPVICETYLLDLSIPNPVINDLIRISASPIGAEITGAIMSPDGKTMLINSQHPATTNTGIYANSLTYAITGWNNLVTSISEPKFTDEKTFQVWPNPVARELNFNVVCDAAIFNQNGQLMRVYRNTKVADVSELQPGIYFVKNSAGETVKLIVQK